jgi:putative aminopeptidase FrvX
MTRKMDKREELLKALTEAHGVPARHIHSHGAIIHRDDYDNALRLLTAVVARLDAETVAGLTQ